MLIREKDKLNLIQIFNTANFPIEIWAYGSRVNGKAHAGSDLDLVIRSLNLHPIPKEITEDLIDKIRESNIPILVELRDWNSLPKSFHQNIEQNYEILYCNFNKGMNEDELKNSVINQNR